jgi:sulfite reductase (ferredoxin)
MAETKIERYERLKREQNPWRELPRLLAALRRGHAALAPDDLNTRLRWWGIYTQGDGAGALGGAAPFFMLRIRIPNGLLTAAQAARVAQLAARHGRGLVDVTIRQNLSQALTLFTTPVVYLYMDRLQAAFRRLFHRAPAPLHPAPATE